MKNVPVSKYHQPHLEDTPGGSAAEDQKSKPTKKSPAPLSTMASESTEMVMKSSEEFLTTQLEDIPGKSTAEDRKSKPAKKSPAPLSTVASESTEMVMESAEELLNTGKPYFCHYYHFLKFDLSQMLSLIHHRRPHH